MTEQSQQPDALAGVGIQALVQQQVEQLQATLTETRTLADQQDCGVTVHWRPMDSAGRMQVEMFLDPDLTKGQVKYVQLPSSSGSGDAE